MDDHGLAWFIGKRKCAMGRPIDLGEADPRPYIRMATRLRRQILAGEIAPGQSVPSLTTLSREFGRARTTCGKACGYLNKKGC